MVRHCIRRQCFILLPNVWVVFKINFAILHKIVAINNVQQSIKQAKGNKLSFRAFALHPVSHVTHPSFALTTWPHGGDVMTCERCVEIFLKAVMFDKNLTSNIYIVETYGYTIFILVLYVESF